MTLQERPVANPVVVLREDFDDWAVLFNPDTADALGINPVGVALWKLMNGQNSLEQMVAVLQTAYAGVPDTAADDVSSFVHNLAERGFVGYEVEGLEW